LRIANTGMVTVYSRRLPVVIPRLAGRRLWPDPDSPAAINRASIPGMGIHQNAPGRLPEALAI